MPRELVYSTNKADFQVTWFSGTGCGGQHRNKHQNCCRLLHLPTGLTTVGQRQRSREQNFKDAFGRLATKIVSTVIDSTNKRGDDETVIRTYHQPDNRVKDVASGITMSYRAIVEKLDIGPMILARAKHMIENQT